MRVYTTHGTESLGAVAVRRESCTACLLRTLTSTWSAAASHAYTLLQLQIHLALGCFKLW